MALAGSGLHSEVVSQASLIVCANGLTLKIFVYTNKEVYTGYDYISKQ